MDRSILTRFIHTDIESQSDRLDFLSLKLQRTGGSWRTKRNCEAATRAKKERKHGAHARCAMEFLRKKGSGRKSPGVGGSSENLDFLHFCVTFACQDTIPFLYYTDDYGF